jgi:hypothetical protein
MTMWWLSMVSRAFCIMDVLMWNRFHGVMKTYRCVLYVFEISAYALCSDSRNFFIIHQIWA